jgi:RNA polymerase sigma factor (sigma-70 family)
MAVCEVSRSRTDDDLIEDCLRGDQSAWQDLVHRYQRLVYSIAHAYRLQPDDASDVFQQVWVELYQRLSSIRDIRALPAWLATVTRRKSLTLVRSSRGTEPIDEDYPEISRRIAAVENEHALERALDQLPDRSRRLVELLYLTPEEPSYAAIAAELGMPVPSIGPTRARCLEKLRKLLS